MKKLLTAITMLLAMASCISNNDNNDYDEDPKSPNDIVSEQMILRRFNNERFLAIPTIEADEIPLFNILIEEMEKCEHTPNLFFISKGMLMGIYYSDYASLQESKERIISTYTTEDPGNLDESDQYERKIHLSYSQENAIQDFEIGVIIGKRIVEQEPYNEELWHTFMCEFYDLNFSNWDTHQKYQKYIPNGALQSKTLIYIWNKYFKDEKNDLYTSENFEEEEGVLKREEWENMLERLKGSNNNESENENRWYL